MRFVISGEWTKNDLLRLIIYFFLFYVTVFWVTNTLLFFNKMSFSYDSVVRYYRGSEEHYLQPRSFQGLLEISHFHLFAMGILMLTLTHLLLFVPLVPWVKATLVVLSFGSAFLDELSSWLICFAHPLFAYLKLASFTTLQLSIAVIIGTVLYALIKRSPSAYSGNGQNSADGVQSPPSGGCPKIVVGAFLALGILPLNGVHADESGSVIREARYVMGTVLEISLCGKDGKRPTLYRGFEIAQELDDVLSNYKPQSEVEKLNREAGKRSVPVSRDLYEMLSLSKSLSDLTDGFFDITIASLLKRWERAASEGRMPTNQEVQELKKFVGSKYMVLTEEGRTVKFASAGIQIDTGGIGKGYAVDKIVELLRSEGLECGLVNFGHSSIYALGAPPGEESWKLLIQFPDDKPLGTIALKDQALSASDSLGRSFQVGSQVYGRLIDTRSGMPLQEKVQAIVVTQSAVVAEALSKAIILQGDRLNSKLFTTSGAAFLKWDYLRISGDRKLTKSPFFPLLNIDPQRSLRPQPKRR